MSAFFKDQLINDQLGRALRDVRVSVMDRCNYRCGYCMPAGEQTRIVRSRNPPQETTQIMPVRIK